jgi:hypothetical protein
VVETDSMLVEPVIGRWRLREGVQAKRGVAQLEDHVVEAARVFVKGLFSMKRGDRGTP